MALECAATNVVEVSSKMGSMVYENEDHNTLFIEQIRSLFDDSLLMDVTLCVQKEEFSCHKLVLAAISPYFRALFTTNLMESKQSRIDIYEVESEALDQIIKYAYTGKIEISRHSVQNLLAAASLFQVLPVQKACAKFMESQLDVNNCIGVHYFAQIHNCDELQQKAKEYIEKNFADVCKTDEFIALPHDKVSEIIASDELNVECEEVVFECIIRWVMREQARRKQYLYNLLPLVRLGLIDSRYIKEQISKNTQVQACSKCTKLLDDLKEFECSPSTYKGEHEFCLSLRSGMIQPEHCILYIGGIDQSKPSINCFNPVTRETFYISEFPEFDRSSYYSIEDPACIVTEDNNIYAAGGNYVFHYPFGETPSDDDSFDDFTEEETVRKDFYQYDNDHNKWISKAPMLFPKSNFSLAFHDGRIYCFGGLTVNQHPTEIIECYDISKNRWNYVGMMPITLVDLRTVSHKGMIFVLGGRTGVGAHNVAMKYDPRKLEWSPLAGMPTPRFNFGACVVDDEIYVAGGQIYSHSSHTINREALKSVEIYSIHENQWRQGPELPEEMYNVALFILHGALYACGTTEYHRTAFRVYRYNVVCRLDMVKNEWNAIETDLCDIRNYSCVAAKLHTRKLSQVFRPEVDT